ncbi:MAG: VOC family protein [Bacteroidia bacterium]|nr:VOC family protein [Bacteroidia bacterium]
MEKVQTALQFGSVTPIFLIFEEVKAREFYLNFLEFEVDWEHRVAPGMPLYFQVSKGNCRIHLSEHHGDAAPGASIRIETPSVEDYQQLLLSKPPLFARPALEDQPWGSREMTITDPFHNRLIFFQTIE